MIKKVVNASGSPAAASNWTLSAAGPTPLSGAGGVSRSQVSAGTYTLSETGDVAGYVNGTTWSCVDGGNPVTVTGGNTVSVQAGTDIACTITNTSSATYLTPGSSAPSAVRRWWSASDRDWITVPDHGDQPTASILTAQGYTGGSAPQYYVSLIGSTDTNQVAVYRWWSPTDRDWVDIPEGSPSDALMKAHGYTEREFQYFAWRTSGTGRVAIYRWWSAKDRDWITIRQGEIADATMTAYGYTSKTLVAYAVASPSSRTGYFNLGTPQTAVVPQSFASGQYPHTMSVLDVNPDRVPTINNGYRYLGFWGHNECGGIYAARSNDLNASSWVQDATSPKFSAVSPCRWAASAIVENSRIGLVVNDVWDQSITGQLSTDGLNGKTFGTSFVLVDEGTAQSNGNPMLFRDPQTLRLYLYWFRYTSSGEYQIRAKSSSTFTGLVGTGTSDVGTLVARSDDEIAAPSVMYVNGIYYLAVETYERDTWKTRVLTATSPLGPFYEIPGNPVYGDGSACVFQHVVGNDLHTFYCHQAIANVDSTWTLNHVRGDLLSPN